MNTDIYYVLLLTHLFDHDMYYNLGLSIQKAMDHKYILFYDVLNNCFWSTYSNIAYEAIVLHSLVQKLQLLKLTTRPWKVIAYILNFKWERLLLVNNHSIYHWNPASGDGTQNKQCEKQLCSFYNLYQV